MKYTKYNSDARYNEIKISFWRLPNVSKFKIFNYNYHTYLWDRWGIAKKLRTLFFEPSLLNRKNNKYLMHCQKLLIKHIGFIDNNKYYVRDHNTSRRINWGYWIVARKIILLNKSFLVKHILKSNSKLGREFKVASLRQLISSIYRKVGNSKLSLKLPMRRKWIQAPAPKCRSLTIPVMLDRIIGSMWTEILELYLKGTMNKSCHGYQEFKGCGTAWIDLLNKQGNYKYIYEFDLENFFPSVQHSLLTKILFDLGIPAYMIIYFLLPLQEKPKLDMELEVPDYQTGKKSVWFKSIYEKINYKGESNYILGKPLNVGVPMGLGYSPLLAILMLSKILDLWKNRENDYVTYADDGILMSNSRDDILLFHDLCLKFGLKVNEKKSRFIREGSIIKEYKFLGLIYKNDQLSSQTRKGFECDLLGDYREIIARQIFGTMLSRLYGGTEGKLQDFSLWWKNHSVLQQVVGWHKEDNRLWLRDTAALKAVLLNPLVCTLQYVRKFSTSLKLQSNNLKWSGFEFEHDKDWTILNVFNHSTYTSNWLVEECMRISDKLGNFPFDNIGKVIQTYEEAFADHGVMLTTSGKELILETPEGPIYRSQVGNSNFQLIVECFGDEQSIREYKMYPEGTEPLAESDNVKVNSDVDMEPKVSWDRYIGASGVHFSRYYK